MIPCNLDELIPSAGRLTRSTLWRGRRIFCSYFMVCAFEVFSIGAATYNSNTNNAEVLNIQVCLEVFGLLRNPEASTIEDFNNHHGKAIWINPDRLFWEQFSIPFC